MSPMGIKPKPKSIKGSENEAGVSLSLAEDQLGCSCHDAAIDRHVCGGDGRVSEDIMLQGRRGKQPWISQGQEVQV
jgi:hypothetical protein